MILIIGATGQTGRATANLLTDRGLHVRALVRDAGKASGVAAEVVAGDAANAADLDRAMRNMDVVVVSTTASAGLPALHRGIYEAAKRNGVRRVVKVSAMGSHPRAKFRFAAAHGESDAALRDSGLAWTVLRPAFFAQNLLGNGPQVAATGDLVLPLAEGRMPPIDARDIAAVAAEVAASHGHEGKAYDLTGPEVLGGTDMAAILSDVIGKPVRYIPANTEAFTAALRGYGVDEWTADGIGEMYAVLSKNAAAKATDTVEVLTGRRATSLQQFFTDHKAAFLSGAVAA